MTPCFDVQPTKARALALKEEGNALLRAGETQKALAKYHFAHLETKSGMAQCGGSDKAGMMMGARAGVNPVPEDQIEELKRVHVDVLNNMAVCLLKQEKWDRVVKVTSDALHFEEGNVKTNMRRAKALMALGRQREAEECVDCGLNVDPSAKDLLRLKQHFLKLEAASKKLQAARMKKMFG